MTGTEPAGRPVARYRVRHRSAYHYDQQVRASFNEARLMPMAAPWQLPLDTQLKVDGASWQYRYLDYWGTRVNVIEVHGPHTELVFDASSVVEVDPTRRTTPVFELTWDQMHAPDLRAAQYEFLAQVPSTEPPADLAAQADRFAAAADTPHEAALAIARYVHDQMTYLPGSTGVNTVAGEAWAERAGVCQDYAHLVIGALRQVGIPARYVSGYLHPSAEPELGEPVVGESHAWVEWWLGTWYPHDPTNDGAVQDRHVMIGTGRCYGDVPPIKGIVAGVPAGTTLDVEVEITRLA